MSSCFPPNATNTSVATIDSTTIPLLKARRSPIFRNGGGAKRSRASRNITRGKSLYAVSAASSSTSAVAACV
jgi:hypothetical protein